MALTADEDTARGIVARWRASNDLLGQVPGGLEQDRGTSSQPDAHPPVARLVPYATFRVDKFAEPQICTGGDYIDQRLVTIEIRGLEAAVATALETARARFIQEELLLTDAVGGKAMGMLEVGVDDLMKDPATKAGEDIWVGALHLQVMSHRRY